MAVRPLFTGLAFILLAFLMGWTWCEMPNRQPPTEPLKPTWTNSVRLYGQPHAVWLDQYARVGANVPILKKALTLAAKARQIPELVIYAIPMRDLGQASEGGFKTDDAYWQDNLLNASWVHRFVQETHITPVIYLEPDSIPLAVQYRRDQQDSAESVNIYQRRIQLTRRLIQLYQQAGAKAYLEVGHSGWFDYADKDVQRIAQAMNEAGVAQADGIASNISNRQPIIAPNGKQSEAHYLKRLLPLLQNAHLDVRVDTSRNGGPTQARQYFLHPDGLLIDNETKAGRLVGYWETPSSGGILLKPFFGKVRSLTRLTEKEKYRYLPQRRLLIAPAWLDAVGDVKLGPAPTDTPPAAVSSMIQHYRYIKPPDDCDGALNCPPGESKQRIWMEVNNLQTGEWQIQATIWEAL